MHLFLKPRLLFPLLTAFYGVAAYGQESAENEGEAAAKEIPATQAPVVQPPAKQNFHVYLLMGQSNMAGRGAITPETQETNPRVLMMTPDGQWTLAKDPLHGKIGRIEPGVGPGHFFALEMLKADPKVAIGLIPCAVGGTPLKRWTKKGDLYALAVQRAKLATQTGTLSGMLWHQGEADTTNESNAKSYEERLARMITDLRQDVGQPDLPMVVGQLGEFLTPEKHPYAETVRSAIRHIPADVPHAGYADSTGLQDKGDKLHFNTDSQKELGARYAKAMQEAQK